jgi:hypothetical protein
MYFSVCTLNNIQLYFFLFFSFESNVRSYFMVMIEEYIIGQRLGDSKGTRRSNKYDQMNDNTLMNFKTQ